MPLARADIESALSKMGFTLGPGDHRYYRLIVNGKETGIMAKQLHLTKKQFCALVECELDAASYLGVLRGQSLIDPAPEPATDKTPAK